VAGGQGLFRDPRNWRYLTNPFRPSWGEPYERIAERVLAAVRAARDRVAGRGTDAVCVSHQLPIVVARRRVEGRPLFHDPRHRQCALASVTSFTFDGERIVSVGYAEPAAAVLPQGTGTGA
jgi:broad specificity phosphatase PhoE